jgi:serine/threonine-protein kinase SRPK3
METEDRVYSEGGKLEESSSIVYDTDEENPNDYKPGGYHPVELNEIFLDRYVVVQKLGWGHFSTVWLCKDLNHNTYVAMKVMKSASHYTEAAYDEIDLLLKVSSNHENPLWVESLKHYLDENEKAKFEKEGVTPNHCFVVQMLNSFMHAGPHGKHVCMVFEILGVNLLAIIKRYNYHGIPIPICRSISKQVLMGLDYLHRVCGIIHTDLKPENVLLQLTQAQINEVITYGMLKDRGIAAPITPPKMVSTMPLTELTRLIPLTEEALELQDKKQRKKDKKRRYKQRRKERERQAKTQNTQNQRQSQQDDKENTNQNIKQERQNENGKKKRRRRKKKGKSGEFDSQQLKSPESTVAPYLLEALSSSDEIDESVKIKIADIGNACWVDNHFSTEIQTRQYRSPEVILGINYNHTADLWSFACMLFELITGDFLFDPKAGDTFSKEDDQLAQMIETLGPFPESFKISGQMSKNFFNKHGELRRIRHLKFWPLKRVLVEKYRIKPAEAKMLADFILPMLEYEPHKRATAKECLSHPWLNMPSNYNYRMSENEYQIYIWKQEVREHSRMERIEHGETVESSPEMFPCHQEAEADVEDNYFSTEEEESEDERQEGGLKENLEYHKIMQAARERLLKGSTVCG